MAGKVGLPWRAASKGLALKRGVNIVGPMAVSAVKAREKLGVRAADAAIRFSVQVTAEDLIIPRIRLEGVALGRAVAIFKIDPSTGERLDLLATATVGEGGWVDLGEPLIVRAGEAFIAVPERN